MLTASINHVTFQYRAQAEPTLFDVSLKIAPGEKVLIVGASGSGKSTIARLLNGLIPHAFPGTVQGETEVMGADPSRAGIGEISRRVGTVLQDTDGQFVAQTAGEDIAFALENDCVPTSDMKPRVLAAAKLVDMDRFLTHAPQALSGGQKQRVALAGVMMGETGLLLFDEPLANLDPATGKRAIELIDDIVTETGAAAIIIEHRLEDALHRPVNRIVLVSDGRIVADMTPDAMLASGLLRGAGVREPLYVEALRRAGCALTPEDALSSIEALDMDRYAPALRGWYASRPTAPENPRGESLLKADNLSFTYRGGHEALRGVGFDIRAGDVVALAGRNGAGKSTLAKLIMGFEKPTSGALYYKGEDMASMPISFRAKRVGYVMQNPNSMITKPMIMEEVGLSLTLKKVDPAIVKEKSIEALRLCGLYEMRSWPVAALSYGQKKRVTIASQLVEEPELLILDEPTAGQDFRNYTRFMDFLMQLNEDRGTTLLLITHDMHLMLEYARRCIVLSDGMLLADTTPARALSDDGLTEAANLKRTSLYTLAERAGIADAEGFINRFIEAGRGSEP